jgi:short-subunit dehydrogenase
MDVRDHHVVLTGASGGIGSALARRLAGAGARLTLIGRSRPGLDPLAAELGAATHVADLVEEDQLRSLIEDVERAGGPVDVLINNAGVEVAGYLPDQQFDELAGLLRLNLGVPVELSSQVLPGMLRRGRGHIVNVSSLAGVATFPGLAAYGASKAGLSHFTSGLRADLRGGPIGTTLVEIGPVSTAMLERIEHYPPSRSGFERMRRLRLLRDLTPEQVAAAVADALAAGRPHVRLPRRAAGIAVLPELPRRVVAAVLTGLAHQDPA